MAADKMTTYNVVGNYGSFAHGDKSYPVVDGQVELPTSERWYASYVSAGILVLPPAEAEGGASDGEASAALAHPGAKSRRGRRGQPAPEDQPAKPED